MLRAIQTLIYGVAIAVLIIVLAMAAAMAVIGLAVKAALFGDPRLSLAVKVFDRIVNGGKKTRTDITNLTPSNGQETKGEK